MATRSHATTPKATSTARRDQKRKSRSTDLRVPEKDLNRVRGGKTPSSGGPVPIPYPNT